MSTKRGKGKNAHFNADKLLIGEKKKTYVLIRSKHILNGNMLLLLILAFNIFDSLMRVTNFKRRTKCCKDF